MTPFKGRSSDATSTSTSMLSMEDSDAAMEESSVLSSPPRSASRASGISLFFEEAASGDPSEEESSFGCHRRGRTTPRNRRLFGDDNGHDDNHDEQLSRSGGNTAAVAEKRSPFAPRRHRSTLKPLDLNNSSNNDEVQHETAEGRRPTLLGASLSMDEADGAMGRKRSSAERRGGASLSPSYLSPRISPNSFMTMDGRFVQSKNPFSSPMMTEDEGGHHHHANVAAAPPLPADDSFFKSTEDTLNLTPEHLNRSSELGNDSSGKKSAEKKLPGGFLPPRSQKSSDHLGGESRHPAHLPAQRLQPPAAMTPFGGATQQPAPGASNVGFPDKRYSFTGSPIPEENHGHDRSSVKKPPSTQHHQLQHPLDSPGASTTVMMETDTASCGSLHKVRRLNLNDDVVSASGHAIRSVSSANNNNGSGDKQQGRPQLRVDTGPSSLYYGGSVSSISTAGNFYPNSGDHEDVSPTDVLSFPPPPTPAKSKQTPTHTGYMSSDVFHYNAAPSTTRRATIAPPTPVAERRRLAAQAARTPHPGSRLHHHQQQPQQPGTAEKSRFLGDFDVIGELGAGCFGSVYRVLSRLDGCMYAIKAAKRQAKGPADRDRMLKEVYALAALSDQADTATFHIVRYHQAWMEDDRLYIQTELCQGSLFDEMNKQQQQGGAITMPRRYKLMREICLALEFLHRHGMVHLDIKPENIFVKNDQFKLGDFGLVTKTSCHQDVEEGDSRYMSMELLAGDHDDLTKSDIFSLGATVYEICLGSGSEAQQRLPHNGPEWQEIRSGRPFFLPHVADSDIVTLLQQMMRPDYHKRPTATELLKKRQLLSDEQKALMAEKTKVAEANMALHQFQQLQQQSPLGPPPLPMRRRGTWNGLSVMNRSTSGPY